MECLHVVTSNKLQGFPRSSEYDCINLQIKLFTVTMSSYLKVSGKWSMRLWTLQVSLTFRWFPLRSSWWQRRQKRVENLLMKSSQFSTSTSAMQTPYRAHRLARYSTTRELMESGSFSPRSPSRGSWMIRRMLGPANLPPRPPKYYTFTIQLT